MKKQMLQLLIVSLCISAGLGIIIILTGSYGELELKILGTTSIIFALSIPALCCASIYEHEKYAGLSKMAITICTITCVYLILMIWEFIDSMSDFKLTATLLLLSYSSGHISVLVPKNDNNGLPESVRSITVVLSIIMDTMLLMLIWLEDLGDFYLRLLWILGILTALGTVVALILDLIKGKENKIDEAKLDNELLMPIVKPSINSDLEIMSPYKFDLQTIYDVYQDGNDYILKRVNDGEKYLLKQIDENYQVIYKLINNKTDLNSLVKLEASKIQEVINMIINLKK